MSWHGDDGVNRQQGLLADDEALALALGAALSEADLYARIESAGLGALGIQRELQALRDELDMLLLDLVHDSEDDEALVAVRDRSGDSARSLVFEGEGVGVELELTDDRVEGQLIPAGPGRVTLQGTDGEIADVATDEVGYFRLEVRPHGPVQLVCHRGDGACATQWLTW
jgi:hypothetical protein